MESLYLSKANAKSHHQAISLVVATEEVKQL